MASNEVGAGAELRQSFLTMRRAVFTRVYEGELSREDENEADKVGVELANKLGYAPNGMAEVLKKLDAATTAARIATACSRRIPPRRTASERSKSRSRTRS